MARSKSIDSSMVALAAFCTFVVVVSAKTTTYETTVTFFHHLGEGGTVFGPVGKVGVSTKFGLGTIFDNPITVGPGESTKVLGRARGLYVYNSEDEASNSNEQIFTIVFGHNSEYEDSTLSFQGLWMIQGAGDRELSVVGGTGAFRFSRGYASYEQIDGNSYLVTVHLNTLSSDGVIAEF